MASIRLVHWKQEETAERMQTLRALGHSVVDDVPADGSSFLRELVIERPDALVIDLARLPMQGRDLALAVRARKSTRHVPIVFVGGEPPKVDRVRQKLPDAVYTSWDGLAKSLPRAISGQNTNPIAPKSVMDGYAASPLLKKLGIKANIVLALIDAPHDFASTLGQLPTNVKLRHDARGTPDVAICFVTTARELEKRIDRLARLAENGGLWIAWPKKASARKSDLTQTGIREMARAANLVDYKICSIDNIWSGMKFSQRKP